MDDDSGYGLAEVQRRLANLIIVGTISVADYVARTARVQVADLLTAPLPWMVARAGPDQSWWAPEVGEQVLVLCPSGDPANGIIAGSLIQDAFSAIANTADVHRQVYSDGAAIEYDRAAHHLDVTLPAGATMQLTADGGLTITGDISLTGTLTASVDVIADGISLKNHTHGSVQPGSGNTGVPQ